MRPLMEILEDERMLMLKLDTIYQNMIRYSGMDAQDVLMARKKFVEQDLNHVRNELRTYITALFTGGDSDES